MNTLKGYVLLSLISIPTYVCPSESELARFTELKENLIFDPSVSDEYVIEMLQEGIQSTNTEVVKLTIQALGRYSDFVILGSEGPFGPVPRRSFEDASTLKRSLIRHWEIGHVGSGFDTTRQMEIDLQEGVNYRQSVIDGNGDEEGSEEPDLRAFWDAVREKVSPWIQIPRMLCLFWPGDEDIHELIWQYHESDRNVAPTGMLALLNSGKFVTTEANEYRINQLVAYDMGEGPVANRAISMAAKGLALSHPEEAIPNLIRAGYDHIEPRSDVLVTLAGYTDSQLNPYYSKLVSLVSVGRPENGIINQELQEALNRLVPYTQGRNPWRD